MRAKCHECMGGYIDGRASCSATACPLYPWMPYADADPDLKWLEFNPKRVGLVRWEDSGREMTDEDREAAAKRLSIRRSQTKQENNVQELDTEEDDD